MKKFSLAILIMFCIILIVGCTTTASNVEPKHCVIYWHEIYDEVGAIAKVSIPEDNVTCYIYHNPYNEAGGISCMRNEVK